MLISPQYFIAPRVKQVDNHKVNQIRLIQIGRQERTKAFNSTPRLIKTFHNHPILKDE